MAQVLRNQVDVDGNGNDVSISVALETRCQPIKHDSNNGKLFEVRLLFHIQSQF